MGHYGTLRNYQFSEESIEDIRGAHLYGANDDKLGKIDDVIFDHATGAILYAVVDTGGWLSSRKFVVPTRQISASLKHEGEFSANLTQEQIERFPAYNEKDLEAEAQWRDYESRYQKCWTGGPVQHRKGTDHNITPTADEMPPEPDSIGSQISMEENRALSERIIPPTANEVTISSSGSGLGDRWSAFESYLRQRRRDITADCTSCAVGPASDSEESAADQRKAV